MHLLGLRIREPGLHGLGNLSPNAATKPVGEYRMTCSAESMPNGRQRNHRVV